MAEYRSNGFPVTIVRPSLTYGVTMIPAAINSWQKPWTIVARMHKGKKIIIHGDGLTIWTLPFRRGPSNRCLFEERPIEWRNFRIVDFGIPHAVNPCQVAFDRFFVHADSPFSWR